MSLANLEKALWDFNGNQITLLTSTRLLTLMGRNGAFPSDAPNGMPALFFFLGEGRDPTRNLRLPPLVHW